MLTENTDVDAKNELKHVMQWATDNRMIVNLSKSKEVVFHRPKPSKAIMPTSLSTIERVVMCKLLGVTIDCNLSFSEHVNFVLRQCSQRMYVLRSLQRRGLRAASLEVVFNAVILSRLIYAVSAWGGFISRHDKSRVDKLLGRAKKYNYCAKMSTFDELLAKADAVLFRKAQSSTHCLS